jgi:hypothetical protein
MTYFCNKSIIKDAHLPANFLAPRLAVAHQEIGE